MLTERVGRKERTEEMGRTWTIVVAEEGEGEKGLLRTCGKKRYWHSYNIMCIPSHLAEG